VGFPKLEEILINDMDNLMMIWHNQLVPQSFCKLKKLNVHHCGNLKKVFPDNMLRMIRNLEELNIWNCASVEEVFEIRGVNVEETIDTVASTLRDMMLCNLPNLKHVWSSDPQANNLTFQNLHEVNITNCISLKSVFPIFVAKGLSQLEKLSIKHCGVEEFVAMEEESKTSVEFVLPQITCLKLEDLPELKCFCPRKHSSKWPSLKRLEICQCSKLEIISSGDLSSHDTNGLDHHHVPIQQPFFLLGK
ncbi:probable disease resistance protein At4g27220, partial [Fagus crenata]